MTTLDEFSLNGSVEEDMAGWYNHATGVVNADWLRTNFWSHDGNWSVFHSGTSGTELQSNGLYGWIGSYILPYGAPGYLVTPGELYVASTWVNIVNTPPVGNPGIWQEMFFFDNQNNVLEQNNGATIWKQSPVGVRQVSVSATAPDNAYIMQVLTVMGSAQPGVDMAFYADDVKVVGLIA